MFDKSNMVYYKQLHKSVGAANIHPVQRSIFKKYG